MPVISSSALAKRQEAPLTEVRIAWHCLIANLVIRGLGVPGPKHFWLVGNKVGANLAADPP
jgi:hypothetical protein